MLQPLTGAGYLLHGFDLIRQPRLRRFVLVPLSVNLAVFALLIWAAVGQLDALAARVTGLLPEWLAWLEWVLWALFVVTAAVVVFFTFSVVANLLAAPFNGLLAEAVERHLTGGTTGEGPGTLMEALRAAPEALWDEVRKVGYFAKWTIPLLLLFLIPVVNVAAPLAWLVFSAWMLAVEYGDYAMGNHGLDGRSQRRTLAGKRWLSLGFGGATLVATTVPVLNFFVMPAAVAGATALWVDQLSGGPTHDD